MGAIASAVGSVLNGATTAFGLNQANQQQQQGYSNANGIINQYYPQAINTLNDLYGNAGTALNQQYGIGQNAINQYYTPYTTTGNAGTNALRGLIDSGYLTHQFNNADLQANLAPNYAFQLAQGQGQVQNAANATGGLIGGNALQGLNTFTQNFAANAYQNAFNNYQAQRQNIIGNALGISDQGLKAAMGQGTSLADLAQNYGQNTASLATNQGQQNANLLTSQANILGNNNINAGNAAAGNTVATYGTIGNSFQQAGNAFNPTANTNSPA
jgi:hypothetical protein